MFWATIGALLFDSAYDLCATTVCAASERERERESETAVEREWEREHCALPAEFQT